MGIPLKKLIENPKLLKTLLGNKHKSNEEGDWIREAGEHVHSPHFYEMYGTLIERNRTTELNDSFQVIYH